MIYIQAETDDFSYDIQAITRSFFPSEKIQYCVGEIGKISENHFFFLRIEYEEEGYVLHIESKELSEKNCFTVNKTEGENWHKDEHKTENPYRKRFKNHLKRQLFYLYDEIGKKKNVFYVKPAWGTLTGVRPVKVAMQILEKEKSEDEVIKQLQEEYLCKKEKAEFAKQIAKKESEIIKRLPMDNSYSLYVGIPFCPTTCLYCSFTSYSYENCKGMIRPYLQALEKEMQIVAEIVKNRRLLTVYIGGGTPTSLTAEELSYLISKMKKYFPVSEALEFTVEAGRPDSITKEKLEVLKEHGVTRISVNPQTMQNKTLSVIGRKHTVEQVEKAFLLAREMGFDNINMDLIMGLPNETLSDFEDTLQKIQVLQPDSLTAHSLVVKRASKLREKRDDGTDMFTYGDLEGMLQNCLHFADKQEYEPYYMYRQKNSAGNGGESGQENIGFSKPGKESLYNMLIMEELQTIVALGAGASTKLHNDALSKVSRIENVKNVNEYITRVQEMAERKKPLLEDIYFNRKEM